MAGNVYLVFGDDEYLVALRAKALVKKLTEGPNRQLGLEVIDGRADSVDEARDVLSRCLEAVRTPGLFERERLVWLRDVEFLADNTVGRSQEVKTLLDRLATILKEGLMPGLVLLVSAGSVDKRFSLYRIVRELGEVIEISRPKRGVELERQAAEIVREQCAEMGLEMDEVAREAFLERTGTETRQIVNEMEKLAAHVGEKRRVSVEDVRAVTSYSRTVEVWDLADAFGHRSLPEVLEVVRQLLFRKESPLRLIMSLESRVYELLIYREALDCSWVVPAGGRYGQIPVMTWRDVPEQVAKIFEQDLERDPRSAHPYRCL
ncbi:MAG: DNA polymerase III subunit delta, partial [Kiritimatiellae bacterium]|nr:DNA polymerase III subunit delta [Kiritimatiellia bacterium]